ncbi:MAG: HAMP domain-containing sensor histidine kinase [Eubacteriales bacterium]|nr:HAMP domain-containing sensor histidine kinase [Eubacteriales bacterium]
MKRRQRIVQHNLWFYFTMAIFGEFCLSILLGVGLILVLNRLFGVTLSIPSVIWVLVASSAVAGIIALLLNHRILRPIRSLGSAMNRVAGGDFKIRLASRSRSGDIQQLYRDFNVMVSELEKTEVLQSDFVSNVSHEFKTPINAIEGYAMLLQDTPQATPEQREYIDRILLNTRRLSSLIGDILLLSKVENQTIASEATAFRLDEQVRQSILLLEPQWSEKEIEFDVELEELSYRGDPRLLLHVWNNLIGNAVKFNPPNGAVRLRLVRADGGVVFTVEDEGPGIPPEARKHIFDKFYQGDSSHRQEGNGLGLALVKRILNACGGEIFMENLPERGCRFTVTLPDAQ